MKNLLKSMTFIVFCCFVFFAGCASENVIISESENMPREAIKAKPSLSAEAQSEQNKRLRPLAGGGGGGLNFEITDFQIRSRPTTIHTELHWQWGSNATFTYDQNGLSEEILFRVRVRNITSNDYNGTIAIKVSCTNTPGPSPVGFTTPYINVPAGSLSDYFIVDLRQREQIERGKLRPGTYSFKAEITYYDDPDWETVNSSNQVTLTLTRPHPSGRAIPKRTFHLTSEAPLTGSVKHSGIVDDNLKASSSGPTRSFISFDLSEAQEEIQKWRIDGWNEFEVTDGILEIEQTSITVDLTDDPLAGLDTAGNWMPCDRTSAEDLRRGHEALGNILLDLLDYGDSLTSSDYNGPIITNLYTFQSACTQHTFQVDAYVHHQLASSLSRIQYRLRLANEGIRVRDDPVTASFKKPCTLTFTIEAKE